MVQSNERTLVLSEDLNVLQVRSSATAIESHTPPLENHQWPLAVGKTWKTKGVMETATGKIDTAKAVEVKSYGRIFVRARTIRGDQPGEVVQAPLDPRSRHHGWSGNSPPRRKCIDDADCA